MWGILRKLMEVHIIKEFSDCILSCWRMFEQDLVWSTIKIKITIWKEPISDQHDSSEIEARAGIKFMVKLEWKNVDLQMCGEKFETTKQSSLVMDNLY